MMIAAITAIAFMWALSLSDTQDVLEDVTLQFREGNAEYMGQEIANVMRPLFKNPRAQVDLMMLDTFAFTHVTPATVTGATGVDAAVSYMWPFTESELHLESVNADGSNRTYNAYIGTVMVWAVDAAGDPTSSIVTCSNATFVSSIQGPGTTYFADRQWVDGTGNLHRTWNSYDPVTKATTELNLLPLLPCAAAMGSLWAGQPIQSNFANYSWFGPFDPGIGFGNQLVGNVPIMNKAGGNPTEQIGRFGSAISLSLAVSPVIKAVLARGGDVSKNGESMLYTAGGVVMGLTPWEAAPLTQPTDVAAIPTNMTLHTALQIIKAKFGTHCPTSQQFFMDGDLIIDLSPYKSENHGFPPLNEAWCQLTVLPHDNIYEEIDKAESNSLWVLVVAGIAGGLAMLLLAISMLLENRAKNLLKEERVLAYQEDVVAAEETITVLTHPMVLLEANDFMAAGKLLRHEDLRAKGSLLYVDNIDDIASLRRTKHIIFLSHQWLGFHEPDAEGHHFAAMCKALRAVKLQLAGTKELYVWCDYSSIAQTHKGLQSLAVSALPVYAAMSDSFVVVAPTCVHRDTGKICNVDSYNTRGWCRAEMLSKVCGSGIHGMYYFISKDSEVQDDASDHLVAMTLDDLERLSLRIFEGTFSVPEDAETLVGPVLGLFSLMLKQKDRSHVGKDLVYKHVTDDKDRFFPETITYDNDKTTETELFGPLVKMMEEHVNHGSSASNLHYAFHVSHGSAPTAAEGSPVGCTSNEVEMQLNEVGVAHRAKYSSRQL